MNDELKRIAKYDFIAKLKALSYIDAIYLFGSRARGDFRHDSDIDIAIACPSASDMQWHTIEEIIENADTLHAIDCVRYDSIQDKKYLNNIDHDKHAIFVRES